MTLELTVAEIRAIGGALLLAANLRERTSKDPSRNDKDRVQGNLDALEFRTIREKLIPLYRVGMKSS